MWKTRRGRLFLVPGDSPIGFRLPLNSLPHVAPVDYPHLVPADPFAPRGPLPDPGACAAAQPVLAAAPAGAAARSATRCFAAAPLAPSRSRRKAPRPRCAPRSRSRCATDGCACSCRRSSGSRTIWSCSPRSRRPRRAQPAGPDRGLPAAARPAPQRHQGDARPRRHRGQCPPGGVLARGGRHHAQRSTRTRAQSRLGTDKFMIDGRHTGTGGGNHIVLGGVSAPDSPFLRRPDLLKSLVLYWQRRPSLSYLFSGLFIGPTSQAPRVDEARQDLLYELEIALGMVPRRGARHAAAVAGRPPVPQPAGRRHRQHPPRRNLHRQAVLAGRPDRPARPGRVPLVRNAARRAHEPRAAIAAARAGRVVLARAARRPAGALGHRAARPLHAGAFRLAGFPRKSSTTSAARATASIPRWFAAQREFRFPALRRGRARRRAAGTAPRARALVRAGRGRRRRRHRALRRFLGRAPAGQGRRVERKPPRGHLQRPPPAARLDRPAGRVRRRRALQGLEAAVGAAADHRRPRAAHLRHLRRLERPLAGRLRLSCRPSGRAQLRDLPGQLLRGGGAAARPVRGQRAHAGNRSEPAPRSARSNTRPRSTCGARLEPQ